jgi:hypothetical protein
MSSAEPHPESPDPASDEPAGGSEREPHGAAAEFAERQDDEEGTPREAVNDALPLPNDPVDHMLGANDLNGEPPD